MQNEKPESPRVTIGSVLDDLGFDPQTALELKLKSDLHLGILKLVRQHRYTARDLEAVLNIQQPRVSELLNGKLHLLSVSKLLYYTDLLGGAARVTVTRKPKAA